MNTQAQKRPWTHNRLLWQIMDGAGIIGHLILWASAITLIYQLWSVGFLQYAQNFANTRIVDIPAWAVNQGRWYFNPFILLLISIVLKTVGAIAFQIHMWMNRNWDGGKS